MKNYKTISTIYYISSLLFYIASMIYFIAIHGDNSMGFVFLCLGSTMLCLGTVYSNKLKKDNGDKEE